MYHELVGVDVERRRGFQTPHVAAVAELGLGVGTCDGSVLWLLIAIFGCRTDCLAGVGTCAAGDAQSGESNRRDGRSELGWKRGYRCLRSPPTTREERPCHDSDRPIDRLSVQTTSAFGLSEPASGQPAGRATATFPAQSASAVDPDANPTAEPHAPQIAPDCARGSHFFCCSAVMLLRMTPENMPLFPADSSVELNGGKA